MMENTPTKPKLWLPGGMPTFFPCAPIEFREFAVCREKHRHLRAPKKLNQYMSSAPMCLAMCSWNKKSASLKSPV
eukprot:2621601-Amphidinium_carterae.1